MSYEGIVATSRTESMIGMENEEAHVHDRGTCRYRDCI